METDSHCYYALVKLTFRRDSDLGRQIPGAYLRAWSFDSTPASAKASIIAKVRSEYEAESVAVEELAPGDPAEILTSDYTGDDIDQLLDAARPLTADEIEQHHREEAVVLCNLMGWSADRWWHFWRWPQMLRRTLACD